MSSQITEDPYRKKAEEVERKPGTTGSHKDHFSRYITFLDLFKNNTTTTTLAIVGKRVQRWGKTGGR